MTVDSTNPARDPPVRPLVVLRAMIDSVDRDVLQLLAQRNALVGEIAAFKRAHRVPIRDYTREREILDDRCHRAGALGLSTEVIESLFRIVLWGSRDRQAALKAEVPLDIEPRTVAVIGGRGAMGRCMANLFADLGHPVIIADIDTSISAAEAARVADVVIVSVPIDVTAEVIRSIGPLVRDDALLLDVTSIKSEPVSVMLEACRGSVVGTHPLFGPSVHSMQGQRVALCLGRGESWFAWLKDMLRARGLILMECTPAEHDRAMSIVQVLTHFSTEVMGRALQSLDVSLDETLRFTSPVYLMELLMTARHFAQSPELYASIQMWNPDTPRVMEAFAVAVQDLRDAVTTGDRPGFTRLFEEVREFFGDFTTQAMEQSSFLIDRLVERG